MNKWWILVVFLAFGLYRQRKWLKDYLKQWWTMMRIAWLGSKRYKECHSIEKKDDTKN